MEDDDVLDRYIQSVERKTDVLSRQIGDVKYLFDLQQQRVRELQAETRRIEMELNMEKSKVWAISQVDDRNVTKNPHSMKGREISVAPQEMRAFENQNQMLNSDLEDVRSALRQAEKTIEQQELHHQTIFSDIFCQKEDLENENFSLKEKLAMYERNLQNLKEMLSSNNEFDSDNFNRKSPDNDFSPIKAKDSVNAEKPISKAIEEYLVQSDGGQAQEFFTRLLKANENLACQLVNPSSDSLFMNANVSGTKISPLQSLVKDFVTLIGLVSTIMKSNGSQVTQPLLFKSYDQKASMVERLLSKKGISEDEDDVVFENLIKLLEADFFDILDSIWKRHLYFEHVQNDVKTLFEHVRLSMMLSMRVLKTRFSKQVIHGTLQANQELLRGVDTAERMTLVIEDRMNTIFRHTIQLSSRAKLEKIRNFALLDALRQSELYEHQIVSQTKKSIATSEYINKCPKCREGEKEIETMKKQVVSNQHTFAILRANLLVLLEEFTRCVEGVSFREEDWEVELNELKKTQRKILDHQDTIDLVLKTKNLAQRIIKERLERSPINKTGLSGGETSSTQKELRRLESSLFIMQEQKLSIERGIVEVEHELLEAKISLLEAQNNLRDNRVQHSLYQKRMSELQLKAEQDAIKFQNKELEISNLKKYQSDLEEILNQIPLGSASPDTERLQKRLNLNERKLKDARIEIERLEESREIYEEQSRLKFEGMAATVAVLHDELNHLSSKFMDCERSLSQESHRRRQLEVLYAGSQACQKNLLRGSRDVNDRNSTSIIASTEILRDRSRVSPQRQERINDIGSVQKQLNNCWHEEIVQSRVQREGMWKRINDSLYSNENMHLYASDTESNLSLPSTYDISSTNIYVPDSRNFQGATKEVQVHSASPTALAEQIEFFPPQGQQGTMMHYLQARGRES
mmetsp:Transcript_49890/g.156167  ORF Transcript_49890/g.156167 Transcript_49890/m.156167 type:complete len:918 (+) Transcript_49890:491-3244(+)